MKLLTIDGNSLINRAFYGIRPLTASDGTPTNAVYGFLSILQKLVADEQPDALCVTFDLPAPTFRHEQYDQYKAHRKGMPDELAVQMPVLKEVLDAMNIPRYELAGWEADDLLGAIAKRCEESGWECVVVTGDKDALQLVTGHTRVKHIKTRAGQTETIDYTPEVFLSEYGFEPIKMIDFKALMGDSSDNIPGVAGVGEKTALDLVQRYGSIEVIYEKLDALEIKDSVRKKLETGRANAQLSYQLAEIRVDAPLDIELRDSLRSEADNDRLFAIFKKLGFRSFIGKFGLKPPSRSTGIAGSSAGVFGSHTAAADNTDMDIAGLSADAIIKVRTQAQCADLLDKARMAEFIAIRLDSDYFEAIAVSLAADRKVYLLRSGTTEGFDSVLKELLSDKINKASHEVKDIICACLEQGIETGGWIFDTALAAYLISATDSNYAVALISERYCGFTCGSSGEDSGQMTMLADSDGTFAEEAFAIGLLKNTLGSKLKELDLEKLYYDMELPLCRPLAEMELTGFLVDKSALTDFGQTLGASIAETSSQIYSHAGDEFNIGSPKQLGAVLFDKLMLPAPKKTKTGYSTNIEVLDQLHGKHPIIALIKDHRELTKLKTTYADGLLKVIGPDGRIHTHFQMTVTATGRLSSTEPNLQNIPVRKKMGQELRKMFVAAEGNLLVDADYSQIELRLLAHIANDPVMQKAFRDGEDIHAVTASQVFGVPLMEVTPIQRFRAKAVNFGIVYGISSFSLSQDIGVMPYEAKKYIENYLAKYAGVREYMDSIVKKAKADGYVATLYGRRRYLPEIKSSNFNMRSFGERVALNMPIQGTAADIMKIAMINVSNRLKAEGLSGKLILQVHDELIAECPQSEAEAVGLVLREEMENAAGFSVPLIAETRVGRSWYDAK